MQSTPENALAFNERQSPRTASRTCLRLGHAWYTRRFGGPLGCGRPGCFEERDEWCVVNGIPTPHDEHAHA